MSSTIVEAMDKAVSTAKATKTAKVKASKPQPEVVAVETAKTWKDALANVLATVPASARKIVTDATNRVVESIHARVKNDFELGELALKVRGAISKESFSRWTYEVIQRVGMSRATLFAYIDRFEIISAQLSYVPAREALIGVTGARGFFVREDGTAKLTGAVLAALKAFPMPTSGDYEDCLDWAHEVQVKIEQLQPAPANKLASQYKQCKNLFDRILNKNHKYAVEIVLHCYKQALAKSVPLAEEIQGGIDRIEAEFTAMTTPQVKTATAQTRERAIA